MVQSPIYSLLTDLGQTHKTIFPTKPSLGFLQTKLEYYRDAHGESQEKTTCVGRKEARELKNWG